MGIMVSEAVIYSRNHVTQAKMLAEVVSMCDNLVEKYRSFLTESEICRANTLIWGVKMDYQYRNEFLANILLNSYRVWDESHKRYSELLKIVAENDPAWLQSVMDDHEYKLRRCKVRVFPLGEARTV